MHKSASKKVDIAVLSRFILFALVEYIKNILNLNSIHFYYSHCCLGALPQVESFSVLTLCVLWMVTAKAKLCLWAGTPLTLLGSLVARLLQLLPVVAKLEAHVNNAAYPVLVEGHLSVPAWVTFPASQASCTWCRVFLFFFILIRYNQFSPETIPISVLLSSTPSPMRGPPLSP